MAQTEVPSPLPGIFYRRPNPDSEPFVVEGQTIREEDIIGVIEVMKQFHELEAGVAGTLLEFRVENGAEIVAGQVLAIVEN